MDNYDNDLIKLDYRKRPKKSADNMTPYDKAIRIMFKVLFFMVIYMFFMGFVSYILTSFFGLRIKRGLFLCKKITQTHNVFAFSGYCLYN